jgi:hypothetical protein
VLRWGVVGVAIGALLATVAALAMLSTDTSDAASTRTSISADHLYPSEYGGDVWITVKAPDPHARTITITWGPWQRVIDHRTQGSRTYVFSKYPTRAGEQNVPVHVVVAPSAKVKFGSGRRPAASIDVNDGWTPSTTK